MIGVHHQDPQLGDIVRRLRVWSLASWQLGDRIATARRAVQRLADLAADADGRPRVPVPELPATALADQLVVLDADAAAAGAGEHATVIVGALAVDLGVD